MPNKCLAACALIIVFTALLGCLYEVSEKPYVVEVDQKERSDTQTARVTTGQMLAGKRLKKTNLRVQILEERC